VNKILLCLFSLLLFFVSCKKDSEDDEIGSVVPFDVGDQVDTKVKFPLESRKKWKLIKVDSFQATNKKTNRAANIGEFAFDDNPKTIWHTPWGPKLTKYPHEIQIDMGEELEIHGFTYLCRQDSDINGTIKKYEFYVSQEAGKWDKVHFAGELSASKKNRGVQYIEFSAVKCRYIRLVALEEVNKKAWTSCAELNVVIEE
jgi:hypothetical protein